MQNPDGTKMTEKEILEGAMDLISDACCWLFETESPEGHAAAWMADGLLKYLQVVRRDHDVLSACCDYEKYEYEHMENMKKKKHLEVIK